MAQESTERVLWAFTAPELTLQFILFLLLAASVFGDSWLFSSMSHQIRTAALVFVTIELLIPLWVYLDLRRNPERSDNTWVHIAAMPLLNIFGLIAYLADRQKK